ncbi:DUF4113 domain-containing protein [Cronobacter dublinensis]|uniref:DUF4113 domain-containing protein n=1 Tax=Cronobacter dublinensis TaxID=413497 RepID=UPI002894F90E|nr:DUF4113 domain-containing protein [Cronobacter dublinensis]MDT3667867.1 DUF4113 domain-containing protein [Cronobacter dublinensis]
MLLINELNQQDRGMIYFAGQSIQQECQMKHEMLSPRYTTRLADVPVLRANQGRGCVVFVSSMCRDWPPRAVPA